MAENGSPVLSPVELLLCLGQAFWEKLSYSQRNSYWLLLDDEIDPQGTPGFLRVDTVHQGDWEGGRYAIGVTHHSR